MSYGVYWGGVACSLDRLSLPRYTRARGVEASVSCVSFRSSVFLGEIFPKFEASRFLPRDADKLPETLAHLNAAAPQDDPGGERPGYRGDLLFAQTFDGSTDQRRETLFRDLYFVEARLLDTEFDDPLVEITLADVRRFWDDYGEITKVWNVEKPGGLAAQGAVGRKEATPLREIMQTLLNALPGKLQIVEWPKPETLPARVVEIRCWGASPKEVLARLLEVYRLEFDIGPDMAAGFYVAGTGTIGELGPGKSGDNNLEHDVTSPLGVSPWSGEFTADGNGYVTRPAHENPVEVVVVGDRTIYDVQVDWLTPVLIYETLDPATGSNVEHVIEATPQNLTDFVQKKLPGQRRWPGPIASSFTQDLLLGLGGQARVDGMRGDVERPKDDPLVVSPAVRVILGDLTPTLPAVEYARTLSAVSRPSGPISTAVEKLKADDKLKGDAKLGTLALDLETGALSAPVQPSDTLLVTHLWQRLPGLEAKDWPLSLRELSEEDRRALKKLWRVYQVPAPLRRLLPIRKRAEVDHKGKRVGAMVEAFGHRATKVQIVDEAEIGRRELIVEQGKVIGTETERFEREKAKALRAAYDELCGDIERMRREVDKIRRPTREEIRLLFDTTEVQGEAKDVVEGQAKALENGLLGATAAGMYRGVAPLDPNAPATGPSQTPEEVQQDIQNDFTAGRLRRLSGDMINALPGFVGDFLTLNNDAFGSLNVLGDNGTTEERRARLGVDLADREARLNKQIEKLEADKRELEEKINPLGAAWKKMGDLQVEAGEQTQTVGHVSQTTQKKIDAQQAEIDKLMAANQKAVDTGAEVPHEERVPMIEVQRFVNLGRRRVEFRVIDAERGLIELQDLPMWVADQEVATIDQALLLPMPVRLTFGTTNSVDVDLVSLHESEVPGFYMGQIAAALRKQPDLFPLLGKIGHKIPVEVGDGQARYTFTKGDAKPRAGDAAVGPCPYRVLIEDHGHPFRLLVRLSGETNDETLRARARAIADALLDRPESLDSGRFVVFEPRRVALNGRISATSITLDPKGAGFVTEISFQSDQAPLADAVEGAERSRGPIRLVFGIDVEEDRE